MKLRDTLHARLWALRCPFVKMPDFACLLAALAHDGPPVKFVQIGAHDGVSFDTLFATVTRHRWPGLVVEPLPDVFARLCANYRAFPEVVPVNLAVHPTDSVATIYRVDPRRLSACPDWAAGIASFDPHHHTRSHIPAELIVPESVRCRPLMDLLTDHAMLDARLLQIDTEGFDAAVLRMIDFDRFRPDVIKFEHANLTAADLAATAALLAGRGYRCRPWGNDTVATTR